MQSANAAVIIAGNPSSLAPSSAGWSWDGFEHSELRSALEDPLNFGSGGIGGSQAISTVDLTIVDAASLAGVDVFVSSWWLDTESAPFDQDVVDWFLAGGDLVLLQDDPNRDGISTLLGFETQNGTSNPTTVSGALGNGPFGSVAPVNQAGNIGHFDNGTLTGLGGDILGLDAAGQATIVTFAPGTFSPTSGSLVALADVDLISGVFGGAEFGPGINDKGRLALNVFASLDAVAVPEPATVALIGIGLLGIGVVSRRRRQV
ncbi:MAG: PEP-CTERM sorting domain-containing protein [Geminicoccaceae bacterium]